MKKIRQLLSKDSSLHTPIWALVTMHILLLIGVFLSLFPFFYILTTAFKTYNESIQVPLVIFPTQLRWDAFQDLLTQIPIGIMLFNSVYTTLVVIVGQVFFSALAGYSLAMLDFPYRKTILTICLAILMVPGQIYMIPQFLLIQKMGLTNTLTAIFLPNLVSAFGTFLFRQAFLGLPRSLYEAATLDGGTPFEIFLKVMFPLVTPTIAAFGVLAGLFNWNSLLWPLIVNTSQSKYPLSVGIATLLGSSELGSSFPTLMASSLIALIPMVILFTVFKKYILDNNSYLGDK
ncbi:MAG: carbohydrate ABC transporter permease [Brevinema sp.]